MKKNKYKVKQSELIESLIEVGRETAVLGVGAPYLPLYIFTYL
jgi:hypothetical protein